MAAAAAKAAVVSVAKRIVPLYDRVLVQKAEAVTRSRGGIVIPDKAQGKVVQGTIVAAGPGGRNDKGTIVPLTLSVGDQVLLPEYGGTKVELDEKDYFLFREHDILAKLHD
jgi:chaperonin GroES